MVTQEEHMKDLEDWKKSQTHVKTYGYGLHDPWTPRRPHQSFFAGQPNPNIGMTPPEKCSPYYYGGQPSENYLKRLDAQKPYGEWTSAATEKDGININLNFFLRLLGATKEVIDDDQKTLEFMMDIKKRLDEANGVTTTEVKPDEYEDED